MNETIKYQYEENNDVYVVEIQETGVERTVDGITVREVFEIFEDEVNDFDEEKLKDIEIIREMIDVVCAITHTKQYIVQLALMVYGVIPITPKTNLKDDNMKWTIVKDEEIEPMTLEEFEQLGTIYTDAKEDIEFEFNNLKQVFFKIVELGFDLTKTNAFKEAKEDWFKSSVEDEDIFLDVFFDKLFDEEICFKEPKNILIEEAIEDASFGYDYGSISSVHHCSIVLGYNVRVEDVE